MSNDPLRIHLSLVSHTNIGKTTLARTLLSRDIGEVADRAHVTETTDDYVLAMPKAVNSFCGIRQALATLWHLRNDSKAEPILSVGSCPKFGIAWPTSRFG